MTAETVPAGVLAAWFGDEPVTSAPVAGGATNLVVEVRAASGRWFLRRSRRRDPQALQREHDLITHVRAAGIPAPRPVPTSTGGTIVEHDGALHTLFEPAVGVQREPEEIDVAAARAAGRMLATIHHVIAALPVDGFPQWTLAWDGAAWVSRLDRIQTAIRAIDARDDVDEWALVRAEAQGRWLADARCAHRYDPTERAQVIHGDYQHANLFFADDEQGEVAVSAVIDWDTTMAMPPAFEVVRACAFMFGVEPTRTHAFVDGYRSVRAMSSDALHDGARAWGCFSDHHVWALEETYLHGNRAASRFIPQRDFEPFATVWERCRDA